MKKLLLLLCAILLVFNITNIANAALIDRGGGLIYDSDQNITWLQDANYGAGSSWDDGSSPTDGRMTWDNAVAWADELVYQGYDDWHLPYANPVNGVTHNQIFSFDGSTDNAHNISAPGSAYPGSTASQMAHLYYYTLGNLGAYKLNGDPEPNSGFNNTSFFINIQEGDYWSGTELANQPNPDWAWGFDHRGRQAFHLMTNPYYSWAVRDGDSSPIPIPSAVWLLGPTLIGLVVFGRKPKN